MKRYKQIILLVLCVWLVAGCHPAYYTSPNIAHRVPYDAGVEQCYGLTADDVTPILGEPVTPTYASDHRQGHCIFVSVAASDFGWGENEYLLTYGPAHEHQYVAIAVRPNDIFAEADYTDPMDYGVGQPLLTFAAELFNDQAAYEQFWSNFDQRPEGDAKKNPAPMLRELATIPSQRTTLPRQFLPSVGDGAIWYWQAAKSGHHLAGLYTFINGEQIALQALVAPQQGAEETQAQMVKLVEYIHVLGKSAPETRSYLNYDPRPGGYDSGKLTSAQRPADAITVAIGQPFVLSPGQSASVEGADFVVTFRKASEESGCVSATDCSQMIFDGSIELQLSGSMIYVNKKATPLSADTPIGAYTDCCQLLMTSIKKKPTGALVATFIVNRR